MQDESPHVSGGSSLRRPTVANHTPEVGHRRLDPPDTCVNHWIRLNGYLWLRLLSTMLPNPNRGGEIGEASPRVFRAIGQFSRTAAGNDSDAGFGAVTAPRGVPAVEVYGRHLTRNIAVHGNLCREARPPLARLVHQGSDPTLPHQGVFPNGTSLSPSHSWRDVRPDSPATGRRPFGYDGAPGPFSRGRGGPGHWPKGRDRCRA